MEVAQLQREKTHLQSSLDALQEVVDTANKRLTPGIGVFKTWMHKRSIDINSPPFVDDFPSYSSENYNVLAFKALLRLHSEDWSSAYTHAKQSIDVRPSAMGYITGALAQFGKGEVEEAIHIFDLTFANCDPNESNLLLLIKAIVLFMAGKYDKATSRVHDLIALSRDDGAMYCCVQVLGKMYLMQGDYPRAIQSLEQGRGLASSCADGDLETVSLIFGWSFDGLQMTVQQYHCKSLLAVGRAEEAAEACLNILETFGEEIRASKVTAEWVADLQKKCVDMLGGLGDAALSSGEHGDAIVRYSLALSLKSPNRIDLLEKRSKARASLELWEDALADANEAIKLDPSSHLGYERKYAALQGLGDYGGAIDSVLRMISLIENSPHEKICQLRENYTSPRETIDAIDRAVHGILSLCPIVLIDVTTGRLCDAHERTRIFKSETAFKKLVSETVLTKIDNRHIFQAAAKYFQWAMFSHTWEGKEPTFQDVNAVDSVWSLDGSPLNEKLRQFCSIAREDGYRWVWSDTCCIDKSTSAVLSQSLTSMYSWYEEAAATLVYLADVLFSEVDSLKKSRWMTRAWTLQELLASKAVRFYDRNWKLYLNDMSTNHKESPAIREELARAMGVAPETIANFQPEDLGVREKLRLASTRNATVKEDIAYSLIGIFSSDIVPRYGLGETAIGHLLENIVARTGDVTVIAWTGKSLPYNSALPATLGVYGQSPYSPPPMDVSKLDTQVEQLRPQLSQDDVLPFYDQVKQLPRAKFSDRCLQLPCIMFPVSKIGVQELDHAKGNVYRTSVTLLGKVEFRTSDVMPLKKPRKLVFVHPWLRDIRDPLDGVSDDELEVDSEVGSDDEAEATSDAGSDNTTDHSSVPISPLHAEPSARVDSYTQALRLIVRLGRPFNALLLEQQFNGQYRRVAAEHEIIITGVLSQTNPKDIRAKVLEII